MAEKGDGFCGHPENAEALRKVLNKQHLKCMNCGQWDLPSKHDCDKAAQVAAIRQRLLDIAAGVSSACYAKDQFERDLRWAVSQIFKVAVPSSEVVHGSEHYSLAVWLWERGCRA